MINIVWQIRLKEFELMTEIHNKLHPLICIFCSLAPLVDYLRFTRKAEAANGKDQKKYPYAPTVNVAPTVYLTASIKLDEFPISLEIQT